MDQSCKQCYVDQFTKLKASQDKDVSLKYTFMQPLIQTVGNAINSRGAEEMWRKLPTIPLESQQYFDIHSESCCVFNATFNDFFTQNKTNSNGSVEDIFTSKCSEYKEFDVSVEEGFELSDDEQEIYFSLYFFINLFYDANQVRLFK